MAQQRGGSRKTRRQLEKRTRLSKSDGNLESEPGFRNQTATWKATQDDTNQHGIDPGRQRGRLQTPGLQKPGTNDEESAKVENNICM